MTTVSRLALAAVLMGAVSLPALAAQTDPATPPAPHKTATHTATAPEAVKPTPGKPADKSAAAMTEKAGSHAPATPTVPGSDTPAQGPAPTKTN